MKISQYVYFDLSSDTVPAAEITAHLGIEPSEIRVRGAKKTAPRPVPANHSWSVRCREPGLRLDAQTEKVLSQLASSQPKLTSLVARADVTARLVFVRYFDDDEGEEELFDATITEDGELLERLPGQHQLLGWVLDPDQLAFLASIPAAIWADEYG